MSQPSEAQQALANETVRLMYGSFPNESIEELIKIGDEIEAKNPYVQITAMNIALRAERERRQAEAVR